MGEADLGLIGLGVMGQNLALNFDDHKIIVNGYDKNKQQLDDFLSGSAKNTKITASTSIEDFVLKISKPRKIMLMIKAGEPVDQVINELTPLLEEDDIIIDGGNSNFEDTVRRAQILQEKNILFVGMGVSGGEDGARFGPAIMPGGHAKAWPIIEKLFQSISAEVESEPCCQWIGEGGAGHYVKMVHNGIEYGDMQLIAEAYQYMHEGLGMSYDQMQKVFREWNNGVLNSYLIEITADILGVKDTDGEPMLEKILDTAGQKGTGAWTGINALKQGVPLTLIGEAVFSRCLSALKDSRAKASKIYSSNHNLTFEGDINTVLDKLQNALYASKIISYAQGFMLMRQASIEYGWNLNYGNIALIWRGGCIIRSHFLNNIKEAFDKDPQLENLLLDDFFIDALQSSSEGLRSTVIQATQLAIPIPAFSSSLSFFDGYRLARGSANMIQAQRDYFGAHTYERVDKPRGKFFHTDWSGKC